MDFEHESSTRRTMDAEALLRAVAAVAREEKRMSGSADGDTPASEHLSERELEALTSGVLARLTLEPRQEQQGSAIAAAGTDVPFVDAKRSRRRRTPLALRAVLAAAAVSLPLGALYWLKGDIDGRQSLSPEPVAPERAAVEAEPTPITAATNAALISKDRPWRPNLTHWYTSGNDPELYEPGTVTEHTPDRQGASVGSRWLQSRGEVGIERFATLMMQVDAAAFRGHRVRIRARIRAEDISGWAGLWLRVDGSEPGEMLGFDNMKDRPITGTRAFETYEVVLEVPQEAQRVAFGVLMSGSGRTWFDDVVLDIVPSATTGRGQFDAWIMGGSRPADYEHGVLSEFGLSSTRYLRSIAPEIDGFGTTMIITTPREARGQRLRMRSLIKTRDVEESARMWLRVDAADGTQLAFDDMEDRPLIGTQDWTPCEIVLDVPDEAARLAYGVLLRGTGEVWFKHIEFEPVDDSVDTTGSR